MSENKNILAAVLDSSRIGTICYKDIGARIGWRVCLRALLATLGPGLIVMAGDNAASVFRTYGQTGQNYGTALLWTLALLVPVLSVCQQIGKFGGAFSAIDLLLLNVLTLVTELIILSASAAFPGISGGAIVGILIGGGLVTLIGAIATNVRHARDGATQRQKARYEFPLLPPAKLKPLWTSILRFYLLVAMGMVVYSVIQAI